MGIEKIEQKNILPIFFTFNDAYTVPALVAFRSLLENADSRLRYFLYVVSIRGEELSQESQEALTRLVDRYPNADLEFRSVEVNFEDTWNQTYQGHYSKEIFLKLMPASIFPEYDWIAYTDVDVVFTGDIAEVLRYPLGHYLLAGVSSIAKMEAFIERQPYSSDIKAAIKKGVGAGFLVYNLARMRESGKTKEMLGLASKLADQVTQPEQDILNIACQDRILHLPLRFMFCTYLYSAVYEGQLDLSVKGQWMKYFLRRHLTQIQSDRKLTADDIREAFRSPIQIHFARGIKPWNTLFCYHKITWFRYLIGTGFVLQHLANSETKNMLASIRSVLKRVIPHRVRQAIRKSTLVGLRPGK